MTLKPNAEELAIIAQEIGAEVIRGPVRYPVGEVVYTDDEGALSRRWTWRQCDRAKSTPQTRNALLTTEGVNDIEREAIEAAIEELVSLVKQYCGGELSWTVLDRSHPWAVSE